MKKVLLLLMFLTTIVFAKHIHSEKHYQEIYCNKIGGEMEVRLMDRTRVDCLTATRAIEVDFAPKWAECIGQALHYGLMTNRKPACLLILEDPNRDKKYLRRLQYLEDIYCIEVYTINPE